VIVDRLERVLKGDCSRLIICSPPGSAKSTFVSVLFPAFYLANFPEASVISAAHTSELSERWGRRVRDLIVEHGAMLGIEMRPDIQAAGRWMLKSGGEYLAAGVGGAILGFRADLCVIDDPVRSREDAMSDVVRRSQWEWFNADLKTRLKPGGRVVIISTRWAPDDLPGRLLRESEDGTGEKWESLILPAIAEENDPVGRKPGEFLWSDGDYGYSSFLKKELATQSPMNWSALYQQRPAPETGEFFKAEWLKPYIKPPPREQLRVYASSDFAVTSKGGDFTVHMVVGMDPSGDLYLLDLYRAQADSSQWTEKLIDMAKEWKPIQWATEGGQIKSSVLPFLQRRLRERNVPLYLEVYPSRHDKAIRAQAIRGFMSLHGLYVDTKASWHAAFVQELLSFPVSRWDDQVDALSLVGMMLDKMQKGLPAKKPKVNFDPPSDYLSLKDAELFDRVAHDNEFHLHMGELDPENERLHVGGSVKVL
jgi:predicted phage terminase large subunit-like protein